MQSENVGPEKILDEILYEMLYWLLFDCLDGGETTEKPWLLWSLYFNQSSIDKYELSPTNLHVTASPNKDVGFQAAVERVRFKCFYWRDVLLSVH